MALLFNNAANQYLETAAGVVTTTPLTMACWFRSDDVSVYQCLMCVADSGVPNHFHALQAHGNVGGDPLSATTSDGLGAVRAFTTAGYTANTWHHACAVWTDSANRAAFIDGANKGTDNNNRTPAGIDTTSIGATCDSTRSGYMSGRIAEPVIWNVALTDGEVAALARGVSPWEMRPLDIAGYWPLWALHSPEIDLSRGGPNPMTLFNGPVAADHAPVSTFMIYWPTAWAEEEEEVGVGGQAVYWAGLPTQEQALGLSIAYADPLVKSPRAGYLGELRPEANTYEHEIAAVGGFLTARFDLPGDMVDVNEWFEHGIGRHVVVHGPDLEVVWEGFVDTVAVNAGQYAATRGPLTDIGNRVYVVYSERDTSVNPPTVIPGRITTIAEDLASQAVYGSWEKQLSGGENDAQGASRARDLFLQENREPTTDDPRIVLEAGGQVTVSVECSGYWAWLLAYPYWDTAGATVTVQTKIQYILSLDPNRVFSADRSQVGYNPDLAPRYENSGTPAWEIVKALAAQGDANYDRWTFGVYAGRVAHYRRAPDRAAYQHRLADPAQRVETIIGDEVHPWDVRPAEWVYLPDFLTGRGQPVQVADRRKDPRYLFIENVRYRAPYGAEITGTRAGKLAQILARQGVGSLGG